MARRIECSACGAAIYVRHLRHGEEAMCRSCGATTEVPESAPEVEVPPDYGVQQHVPATEEVAARDTHDLVCLKCGAELRGEVRWCPGCGYSLADVRLYNPKRFALLAILFSALVPIYLAATNWGRVGESARGWKWLSIGFLGFVILLWLLSTLPDTGRSGEIIIAYAVNVPIGWLLAEKQRSLYRSGLALGAQPASTILGSLKGAALVVLAIAVLLVGSLVHLEFESRRAIALYEEGECAQAAALHEKTLRRFGEDEFVRFNLGLCYLCMERWEDAEHCFRSYVRLYQDDPQAHALLAMALYEQGKWDESEEHLETAERLDPEVTSRLFGSP